MGKERTVNMTQLSQLAFSEATTELHSVEDAVNFLKKELVTRNIRSILENNSEDSSRWTCGESPGYEKECGGASHQRLGGF